VQDFSGFANLLQDFVKGRQAGREEQKATLFRNGIPRQGGGETGPYDIDKIATEAAKVGGVEYARPFIDLQVQSQNAAEGRKAAEEADRLARGGGSTPPSNESTPSPRVKTPVLTAAPSPAATGNSEQDTIRSLATESSGGQDAMPVIGSAARVLRINPDAPLTPDQVVKVKEFFANSAKPPVAPPPVDPATADPSERIAKGFSAAPLPQVAALQAQADRYGQAEHRVTQQALTAAASGNKLLEAELRTKAGYYHDLQKGILDQIAKANEMTPDMKNAAASGQSLTDYQNRTDENTTQRDILTKSIIPRIDKSQEMATAARDDIDAIHRARAELDKKGGVFSGAFADKKLYLAKAAEVLGIPNADKIKNTEAYGAAIGSRVASMVKAFGSGTAISDGDRRFAAAMAGGQITLDEKSMRRILEIGEKAARGKIKYHNEFVDKSVKANDGLKAAKESFVVEAPKEYKKEVPSAVSPQEGDVIFNAKTGERLKLQGGKWAPVT